MGRLSDYVNQRYDLDKVYFSIFHRSIPSGKMYCNFHGNTQTPAAKRYGNTVHCFVCRRNYTAYDYLKKFRPAELEKIRTSLLLPLSPSEKATKAPYTLKPLNRDLTIDELVKDILNDFQV